MLMVEEEVKKDTTLKLNLGCGQSRIEGFIGVDCVRTSCTDLVLDLEKHDWPWSYSSVSEVVLIHTLEHIGDIIGFMHDLYRVMKPDGIVTVIGPYYNSVGCWQDPTHKQAISEKTFQYFSKKVRESEGMMMHHYPIKCDFEVQQVDYQLAPEFAKKSDKRKAWCIKHLTNVVDQFRVVLKAVK